MEKLIVVALGGNAIQKEGESATAETQYKNIRNACEHIIKLVKNGYKVVITHGNGPQVGNLLVIQEEAKKLIPPFPLDMLVSRTQGGIGYTIQRAMCGELAKENLDIPVVSIITQVLVDQDDPAFNEPSKPVGPFYNKETADDLVNTKNYVIKEIKPNSGKYRRVVPSPKPLEILEKNTLKTLVDSGCIVVACGGGGIPVAKSKENSLNLIGIEAVIDKDLSGEKLAETLSADILLILTDVENVKLNYGKPNEINVNKMSLDEAIKNSNDGQFLSGSMKPKVMACIKFLEWGGEKAIIGSLENVSDALDGKSGTTFYK